MKILYTTLMQHYSSGIVLQMYNEYKAAKKIGIPYDVKIFMPEQNVPDKYKEIIHFFKIENTAKFLIWFEIRKKYYEWLNTKQSTIDIYVLRYLFYDPYQYFFIKDINKQVYLVHHTLELPELRMNGIKGNIQALLDNYWGNKSIRAAFGVVGVTDEIVNYEKERIKCNNKIGIIYPNGITVNKDEILDSRKIAIPEILFVASYFYDWHGLDLLIEAARKSNLDFIIHIVGNISDKDLENMKKDKRFIIHNSLRSEEIDKLSAQCWIALGSFALYRKKLTQGSTLKVREYLNNGLPVYSGHQDIFPYDFLYYKYSKLDLEKILNFAYEMRNSSKEEVRDLSKKYISKDILLKNFYIKINKNFI